MMRVNLGRLASLSAAIVSILFVLSSCSSSQLCCADQPDGSPQSGYCGAHRDVVVKYVQSVSEYQDRRARLERVKSIYNLVKFCRSMECIEHDIFESRNAPEAFVQRFALEHELAEQNLRVRNRDKADLTLCGLNQGIQEMELWLQERGY